MLLSLIALIPPLFFILEAVVVCLIVILLMPLLLLPNGNVIYTKCINYVGDYYWIHLVWYVEKWGRVKFHFYGDNVKERESVFLISNHTFFLDWLLLFSLAMRKGRLGCCNFFAKDSIKYIPGMGWGIYLKGSVLLKRRWADDAENIRKTFQHLRETKVPVWLISHPEGTRFTKEKLAISHSFAKKNNLPILNHVLLPRTKGFVASVKGLREGVIDAVYDITIAFENDKKFSLKSLFLRKGDTSVHFYIRRYSIDDLPKDDKGLEEWLIKIWVEKEKLLEEFKKNGKFKQEFELPYTHTPMKLF